MRLALIAAGVAACALAQDAAPPSQPTPKWPDGRVNLGSTPEHKGYWEVRPGGSQNIGTRANQVPFQPWAQALYQYRQSQTALYPPLVKCKPASGPSFFNSPGFEIVDVPELKQVFLLNIAGPHSWRVIYMDGRQHPPTEQLRPTYFGHSIGRWEGDTLVIDSVGFNEKQWLTGAFPTTSQLHLVERITRPTLKSMTYEAIIDDPGAYTGEWRAGWSITETTGSAWIEGGEMFEYICQDPAAE